MSHKLGKGRGTLQRVWGDVLKVMKFLYGKRVMAGSEAQVLVDEGYAAKYYLGHSSFPEVEILASSTLPSHYSTVVLSHIYASFSKSVLLQ